jgi:hypothetical protein
MDETAAPAQSKILFLERWQRRKKEKMKQGQNHKLRVITSVTPDATLLTVTTTSVPVPRLQPQVRLLGASLLEGSQLGASIFPQSPSANVTSQMVPDTWYLA